MKNTGVLLPTRSQLPSIGRAELAGDSGEAQDQICLRARLQHLGFGVRRDVTSDGQRAVRAPAFSVHHTLRDTLTILMSQFLDQLIILQ
jgi:hypothetical protein